MEDGFLGLPFDVKGTDGVEYQVRPYAATVEGVESLWAKAGRFRHVFPEFNEGDRMQFINYFLNPAVIVAGVWKGDEHVGIVYADQIRPEYSARVHYLFWDKIQHTREPVLLRSMLWLCETFDLARLSMEVPWHAYAGLRRLNAMGIWPEGIRRGSTRFQGKWRDELLFGVRREQLTPEAVERGKLEIDSEMARWFGLVDSSDDRGLARILFRRP